MVVKILKCKFSNFLVGFRVAIKLSWLFGYLPPTLRVGGQGAANEGHGYMLSVNYCTASELPYTAPTSLKGILFDQEDSKI